MKTIEQFEAEFPAEYDLAQKAWPASREAFQRLGLSFEDFFRTTLVDAGKLDLMRR